MGRSATIPEGRPERLIEGGLRPVPLVVVKLYEGRSIDQKRAAAKAITAVIVETLKTTPEATQVIFEDVAKSDWASAGKLASD
jgi:4-oxalocrotonate tautomerase